MDFKNYYKQQKSFINLSKAKIELYKALKAVFRFKIWQKFFQAKIEFYELNIQLIEDNLKMHEQLIEQTNEQMKIARHNLSVFLQDTKKITKDF